MKMRIKECDFTALAEKRSDGFLAAVRAVSTTDGAEITIERDAWLALSARHGVKILGLGDAVAAVAQPIAGAIDAVLGTNVKGCAGCAQRREALNRAVPLRR